MVTTALRARNIRLIAQWLATYAEQGGPLTFETRCGEALQDNQLVFRVADWQRFVRIMDGVERESA